MLDRTNFAAALIDEASQVRRADSIEGAARCAGQCPPCPALQATEPAVCVPISRGPRTVALFGDHKQLPPTVISREAELAGLGVSLFDRLTTAGAWYP